MDKLQLSIIPSFYCNYNCQYCYLGDLRKDKKLLNLNDLEKRLQELSNYKIDNISVYGGELSLLNKPYLEELIKILPKCEITFTTNASNPWLIDWCHQNNIHIAISLNEERPNYHQTIQYLKTLSNKNDIELSVVVLPSLLNKSYSELYQFYNNLGYNVYFIQYHPSKLSKIQYNISQKDYNIFLENMIQESHKHNGIKISNEIVFYDKEHIPTKNGFLFINPNGNYSTVIYDENNIEEYKEYFNLTDWYNDCYNEKQWYFNNCLYCEYYNKCKAEHLVNLQKPYCSGLYNILKLYK